MGRFLKFFFNGNLLGIFIRRIICGEYLNELNFQKISMRKKNEKCFVQVFTENYSHSSNSIWTFQFRSFNLLCFCSEMNQQINKWMFKCMYVFLVSTLPVFIIHSGLVHLFIQQTSWHSIAANWTLLNAFDFVSHSVSVEISLCAQLQRNFVKHNEYFEHSEHDFIFPFTVCI